MEIPPVMIDGRPVPLSMVGHAVGPDGLYLEVALDPVALGDILRRRIRRCRRAARRGRLARRGWA